MPTTQRYAPEDVLDLTEPTSTFLCTLAANTYKIEFNHFQIKDYVSKQKIFEIGVNCPPRTPMSVDLDGPVNENTYRKIRYEFSEDVLRLPSIQTSLNFSVGPKELSEFRMIERHYFRNELVKSFDFTFGFVIPGSTNNWDAVYAVPPIEDDLIEQMIEMPYASSSDTFYFVGDELIMHNKAEYKYIREDQAQAKRSYYSDEYMVAKEQGAPAKGCGHSHSCVAETKDEAKDEAKQEKWSKEEDYGQWPLY